MKRIFAVFLCILQFSCSKPIRDSKELRAAYSKLKGQKNDTVVAFHCESTGCLDLYIESGKLRISREMKSHLDDTNSRDILIAGNFPDNAISDPYAPFPSGEPGERFEIVGKVVGIDSSNNPNGRVPIFYVVSWRKCKK